jgi:hypothetical protein
MAGLGAAHFLRSVGVSSTLFDQRSRLGGHTSSCAYGDGFVFDEGPHVSFTKDCYCAIEGDWLVFSDVGGQGQRQLFRRNPQRAITQVTDFLASSTIDRLADNGDVTFTSGGQRYLSRGAGSFRFQALPARATGSTKLGTSRWAQRCSRSIQAIKHRRPSDSPRERNSTPIETHRKLFSCKPDAAAQQACSRSRRDALRRGVC